ncbi:MAG: hypothetical protein RIA65_05365 [Woeseia sp.]
MAAADFTRFQFDSEQGRVPHHGICTAGVFCPELHPHCHLRIAAVTTANAVLCIFPTGVAATTGATHFKKAMAVQRRVAMKTDAICPIAGQSRPPNRRTTKPAEVI